MRLFQLADGRITKIPERSYRDNGVQARGEETLEGFLVSYPEIIPSEAIDPNDPPRFACVRSQGGVTPGSFDVLLIDHKAVPTVVEAKLIDNREIRRSVLAQGIEYLAHFREEWTPQRIIEAGIDFWRNRGIDFLLETQRRLEVNIDDAFLERIAANIAANQLRLIVAADEIPTVLQKSIEFLFETADFEVYGLEVRFFSADGEASRILAPSLVGASERGRGRRSYKKWNEDSFFEALSVNESPHEEQTLIKELFEFGKGLTGREIEWGAGTGRGSGTARLVVGAYRFSLFSMYTTRQFSLNMGWSYRGHDDQAGRLAEEYRVRAKSELGLDFNERTWKQGWPMADVSTLVPDRGARLKSFVERFVADVASLDSAE